MNLRRHDRIFNRPQLHKPLFGPAADRDAWFLRDDQIGFAAAQRMVVCIAQHPGLAFHIVGIAVFQIAEQLVDGAIGKDHHVARLPAVLREPTHAVDEGHHHDHQANHEHERQGREQRGTPADFQIPQRINQRNFAQKSQRRQQRQARDQRAVERWRKSRQCQGEHRQYEWGLWNGEWGIGILEVRGLLTFPTPHSPTPH